MASFVAIEQWRVTSVNPTFKQTQPWRQKLRDGARIDKLGRISNRDHVVIAVPHHVSLL